MNPVSDSVPLPGPIKSKIKSLVPVIGLVLILPVIVGAVKLKQQLFPRAATTPSVTVQISPGIIRNLPLQKPFYLSAQAILNGYQPLSSSVVYEWGLSSTGSLGSLKPNFDNTAIATYIPTGTGSGDLWVKATTPYGIGIGTARVCQETRCESVSWSTDNIIFTANDFYFIAGNEKFLGLPDPGTSLSHISTLPSSNSATFEAKWTEHGKPITLQLFFARDSLNWWVSGYSISIYQVGRASLLNQKEFIQLLGTPIRISYKFPQPSSSFIQEVYVDNLYLQAFLPSTPSTPIPTPVLNNPPVITTTSLPPATIGQPYSASIAGSDLDLGDTLNLILQIPTDYGLAAGPCAIPVDPRPGQPNTIECILSGTPSKSSSTPIPITATLSDGRGGSDRQNFPLTIFPIASPTPTPTPNPKLTCTQTGGTWREFPNSCADICSPVRPEVCLPVVTPSCDCGPQACWSGTACIPNPYPSPTPTPTPVANSVPEIVTSSLPPATLGLSYSTNIEGRDADLKDILKMSLEIPDGYGLQPGPCAIPVALTKPGSNIITCILYGTPIKYSSTPIPIGIVISDNRGGSTRGSLPLTLIADKPPIIQTKILPIAKQFRLYTANVVAKSPINNEKVTINISGLPLGLFYSCSIKSPVTTCKIYGSVIYHSASGYPVTITATDSRGVATSTVLRLNTKPWRR